MTDTNLVQTRPAPARVPRKGWGWFLILGMLPLAVGTFAFIYAGVATLTSMLTIGVLMAIGGIAHIALAYRVKVGRMRFSRYSAVCSIFLQNPLVTSSQSGLK